MDNLLSIQPYNYKQDEIECITLSDCNNSDDDSIVCLDTDGDQLMIEKTEKNKNDLIYKNVATNQDLSLHESPKRVKKEDSNQIISPSMCENKKLQTSLQKYSPKNVSPEYNDAFSPESIKSQRSIKDGDMNINQNTCFKDFEVSIIYWKLDLIEQKDAKFPNKFLSPVDRYQDFEDYYKYQFNFLLLETWEEINYSLTTNINNKNSAWIKGIGKCKDNEKLFELVCQTPAFNKKPNEEDLFKIEIEIEDKGIKQNKNIFGLIKTTKEVNVTETRILPQIKSLNNVKLVFELVIHTPKLNYTTEVGSTIKIKKIKNLSSKTHRLRAILKFKDKTYKSKLLSPEVTDSIFSLSFQQSKIFTSEFASIFNYLSVEPKFIFIDSFKSGTLEYVEIIRNMLNSQKREIKKVKILVYSPNKSDELANSLKDEIQRDIILIANKNMGLVNFCSDEQRFTNQEQDLAFENIINGENFQRNQSLMNHVKNMVTKEQEFKEKLEAAKKTKNFVLIHEKEEDLNEILKKKKDLEIKLRRSHSDCGISGHTFHENRIKESSIILISLNSIGYGFNELNCLLPVNNDGNSLINVIIILEATKCSEIDFLTLLRFGCNKFIFLGDCEQISSKKTKDNKSLFERIYHCFKSKDNNPIKKLTIQIQNKQN